MSVTVTLSNGMTAWAGVPSLQAARALTMRPRFAQRPPAVLKQVVEGVDEIHAST